MKAAICERYGPPEVVTIKDIPKPAPKDDEILVKLRATTVNSGDVRLRALNVPRGLSLPVRIRMGFSGPRQPILGFEFAGDVEAVGKDVTRFKPGDKVLGSPGFALGCHVEYRTMAEAGGVAPMPGNLTYVEAVAICFGGVTALTFFRCGDLKAGESILINGASGAVGTAAVQIAKHRGATVTGVCSAANADLMRSLGADRVIDYRQTDFTQTGVTYDLIMDNVGNAPFSRVRNSLKPNGRFLMVIGDLLQMIQGRFNKQVIAADVSPDEVFSAEAYAELARLAEAGALKPVIGGTFPLDRIVEAHRLVDGGHKTGSVVVTVG